MVPISEGGPGLADAAWEGDTGERQHYIIIYYIIFCCLGNTQSTPSAVSEQSNVSAEQEVEQRQGQTRVFSQQQYFYQNCSAGWLDSDLKNSNNFLDDDDVDDLGKNQKNLLLPLQSVLPGFDPFHETQKGLADLLESEAAEAQQQAKVKSLL